MQALPSLKLLQRKGELCDKGSSSCWHSLIPVGAGRKMPFIWKQSMCPGGECQLHVKIQEPAQTSFPAKCFGFLLQSPPSTRCKAEVRVLNPLSITPMLPDHQSALFQILCGYSFTITSLDQSLENPLLSSTENSEAVYTVKKQSKTESLQPLLNPTD